MLSQFPRQWPWRKSELIHTKGLEMPNKHEHCCPQFQSWGCRGVCPRAGCHREFSVTL